MIQKQIRRPPIKKSHTSTSSSLGKNDYEHLSDFRHRLRQFLRASELACRAHGLTALQYQLLLHVAGFPGRPKGERLLAQVAAQHRDELHRLLGEFPPTAPRGGAG